MMREYPRGIAPPIAPHLTWDPMESSRVGCPVWSFIPTAKGAAKPCTDCRGIFRHRTKGRCVYCHGTYKQRRREKKRKEGLSSS